MSVTFLGDPVAEKDFIIALGGPLPNFFAILPPRWHHSREELAGFRAIPFGRWFQYGYCAWRFTDTGAPREDLSGVDRRWDPRCDDA
ncbi:MAG: hypothetical protein IH998_01955 [Proteobacteria bacterium]|nr:hypothetical protein [Pseudomonadota bacterium]